MTVAKPSRFARPPLIRHASHDTFPRKEGRKRRSGAPQSPAPSPGGYAGPNRLDQPEGPCALQKPIGGAEQARRGEAEDEPMAAAFKGVTDQHGGHCEKAEKRQSVHHGKIADSASIAQFFSFRQGVRNGRKGTLFGRGDAGLAVALLAACRLKHRVRDKGWNRRPVSIISRGEVGVPVCVFST